MNRIGSIRFDPSRIESIQTVSSSFGSIRVDSIRKEAVELQRSRSFEPRLKDDGSAWATGLNDEGQLGDGTTMNKASPVQVMTQVKAVAAGELHTIFVTAARRRRLMCSNAERRNLRAQPPGTRTPNVEI